LPPSKPVERPLPEAPAARTSPVVKPGPAYTAPEVPLAWNSPPESAPAAQPPTGMPLRETAPVTPSLSRTAPRIEQKPEREGEWSLVFFILVVLSIVAGWLLTRSGILF
jgi:hypothetical protein